MSDPYVFQATVLKIIDGDTVDVDVDLGWNISVTNQRIRLHGVDCPESRTRDLEEKKYGLAAKAFVQEFLKVGSVVTLRTLEKGKYGRYLGELYLADGRCVNKLLEEEGHCKEG